MKEVEKIRIGTRGSRLALAQTDLVFQGLKKRFPNFYFEIQIIKTQGDQWIGSLEEIGGKGVFVKEIEDALLRDDIDLAVHSLKDLPTEQPERLEIGATLSRGDARDVLVSNMGNLQTLPRGSRIGTGSPRRRSQLLAFRRDFQIENIRGNVDTRLRKLEEGDYEAIVLAAAGLERLGILKSDNYQLPVTNYQFFYLPFEVMLPPAGQGVLAVEMRKGDQRIKKLLKPLDHTATRIATRAEIAFQRTLGGGCSVPIAAHARFHGHSLILEGLVISRDGNRMIRKKIEGSSGEPEKLGSTLAETLIENGAREILNED